MERYILDTKVDTWWIEKCVLSYTQVEWINFLFYKRKIKLWKETSDLDYMFFSQRMWPGIISIDGNNRYWQCSTVYKGMWKSSSVHSRRNIVFIYILQSHFNEDTWMTLMLSVLVGCGQECTCGGHQRIKQHSSTSVDLNNTASRPGHGVQTLLLRVLSISCYPEGKPAKTHAKSYRRETLLLSFVLIFSNSEITLR